MAQRAHAHRRTIHVGCGHLPFNPTRGHFSMYLSKLCFLPSSSCDAGERRRGDDVLRGGERGMKQQESPAIHRIPMRTARGALRARALSEFGRRGRGVRLSEWSKEVTQRVAPHWVSYLRPPLRSPTGQPTLLPAATVRLAASARPEALARPRRARSAPLASTATRPASPPAHSVHAAHTRQLLRPPALPRARNVRTHDL